METFSSQRRSTKVCCCVCEREPSLPLFRGDPPFSLTWVCEATDKKCKHTTELGKTEPLVGGQLLL